MIRWFWRLYIPLAVLAFGVFGLGPQVGPRIELAIAPVLTDQKVSEVERESGRITFGEWTYPVERVCWRWDRIKQRPASFFSPDIDVHVESRADTSSLTITNKETGAAWAQSSAIPAGHAPLQHWCVVLPPNLQAGAPVRVHQTANYPGYRGLWSLPVPLPDVVDPPEARPLD